jgi:hypothetical protein
MKLRLAAAAFVLIACTGANGSLLACGDKFLVVSRGTRYKHANAPRTPAVILIYANPASNLPKALANLPVDTTLRKAGYQPTSVESAEDFDKALEHGKWDLILVDESDGQSVLGRIKAGAAAPVVLPVYYKATSAELKQAKKLYPQVLESPTKSQAFLDTIDDALASRPKTSAEATGKTG